MSKTILTGLRANSDLHLGNYLGAILPMVKLQQQLEEGDRFHMFVPDLHSFTTPIDHDNFYAQVLRNFKVFLAAGIDPEDKQTVLYRQSRVPAHSEMAWILSCFTYFGEASKMTQFKDKSRSKGENVSVGLFTYPILMAADILLYEANYIPIGTDQRQHLELARNLAQRINNKFRDRNEGKEVLTVPEEWSRQLEFMKIREGVKIRSLQNPEAKMSKSVEDPKGTILMMDEPAQAAKKIKSAVTDEYAEINWDWEKQPGITNLLQILAYMSEQSVEKVVRQWQGYTRYGDLKKGVAQVVEKVLTGFQERLSRYSEEQVEAIFAGGEQQANELSKETLGRMQKMVGLK
jgi:tryptophanyl-tRNA synthetase